VLTKLLESFIIMLGTPLCLAILNKYVIAVSDFLNLSVISLDYTWLHIWMYLRMIVVAETCSHAYSEEIMLSISKVWRR